MDEPRKGAYENVYMQEMFDAVGKAQDHRQKGMGELQKIGKSSKTASKLVKFLVAVTVLAILGASVYLAVAEPRYTFVVGAFLGIFALFAIIVSFLRR